MPSSLSQVCQLIVDKLEAISTSGDQSSVQDKFHGVVGLPDSTGGDRCFGVVPPFGGVRATAAPGGTVTCPDVHEVELSIIVNYTYTQDAIARVADDGEDITEALEDLRAAANDILDIQLEPGDIVPEPDAQLIVATRSMVVQYQRA